MSVIEQSNINIESLEQEIDLDEGEVTEKKKQQSEGSEEDHVKAV